MVTAERSGCCRSVKVVPHLFIRLRLSSAAPSPLLSFTTEASSTEQLRLAWRVPRMGAAGCWWWGASRLTPRRPLLSTSEAQMKYHPTQDEMFCSFLLTSDQL